jgi:hypothetical protein
MTGASQCRSLIIVSRDYGELALTVSWLRGQQLARGTLMLLPEPLYGENQGTLPVPALPYATLEDLLSAVNVHRPDLVFLFSGYLLILEHVVSRASLNTLLRRLNETGCRVITSDPFLGLASRVTRDQLNGPMLIPGESALKRWMVRGLLRLQSRTARVVAVPSLETMTHLYPTAIPATDDGIPRASFFNSAVLQPTASSARAREPGASAPAAAPEWLFVLSAADLHVQRTMLGLRQFTEVMLGILRHALEAERRATLIAPPLIIEKLMGVLPDTIKLLAGCSAAEFERRMLEAEYAFSWNPFSFSQMQRMVNERPMFFFDRGHAARAIKPFYNAARACHFGGWEPRYMDQRQVFSPYVLAHLASEQKPALHALRERWQASPSPDLLVDQLLDGRH